MPSGPFADVPTERRPGQCRRPQIATRPRGCCAGRAATDRRGASSGAFPAQDPGRAASALDRGSVPELADYLAKMNREVAYATAGLRLEPAQLSGSGSP